MNRCRARLFHDLEYNWYWYCFDHGELSDKIDTVPGALEDLDYHRRDMIVSERVVVQDMEEPPAQKAGGSYEVSATKLTHVSLGESVHDRERDATTSADIVSVLPGPFADH